MKHQVPAGLNFAISGIPYWTTDIGGYGFPNSDTSDPKHQEVFTRWFEYGAFCPLFRIHGQRANNQNELWAYGAATPTLVKFDRLRYRLLPYIYSLAWQVTKDDYTIMRPLAMDWRGDRKVWEINDEFMFGPALLVSPVTAAGDTSRRVYLPAATDWYDFWTGERVSGEQAVDAAAPIDRIPLYVRAGSIVPRGPEREYARENPDAPIKLRVYRGADGSFLLYQDQGDSYAYEHGAYATIPIRWEESSGTLTIGARQGSYPGMASQRKFHVVWVDAKNGGGAEAASSIDKEVVYFGQEVRVSSSSASGK